MLSQEAEGSSVHTTQYHLAALARYSALVPTSICSTPREDVAAREKYTMLNQMTPVRLCTPSRSYSRCRNRAPTIAAATHVNPTCTAKGRHTTQP